jgi:hypothetical protein
MSQFLNYITLFQIKVDYKYQKKKIKSKIKTTVKNIKRKNKINS